MRQHELKLMTTFFLHRVMPFQPFNPNDDVHVHRQNLPHWRQWGTTYFVTSRLGDSVPVSIQAQWRARRDAWLRVHGLHSVRELDQLTDDQRHEYHREFTAKFHELLDAEHGECHLAKPALANLLAARFAKGHGTDYQLDAWVIMPNHFHALVEPAPNAVLGDILQHWKGGSAREINLALGRSGPLWQVEPFDHIVRSEAQLQHFRRYVAMNPSKAGLQRGFQIGIGAEAGVSADEVLARFGLTRNAK